MLLLLIFAFIAGVVTILSPCILPILPIVLSGGIGGGKRRPLGVVAGFVASFTFFTLFLATIVRATGISADALRTVSVVIIFVFGASLLSSKTQLILETLFSKLSNLVPNNQNRTGFVGGLVIGVSLGLVWTPCVGPIIASVISLALTGTVTASAFLITAAYSLGTAIPMFAVIWGGRQLLTRAPWLVVNTGKIQKVFGVLMILTAIAIFFGVDRRFQAYVLEKFPQYGTGLTKIEDNQIVRDALEGQNAPSVDESKIGKPMNDLLSDLGLAPEITPGGRWFNLPEGKQNLTLKELRGKVVLIDFWTYTCINCIRTLPYLKSWDEKYRESGLVIIGIHSPEFEFEKSANNVAKAIDDYGLKYTIVQDNDFATWRAYNNRYWPAKYLIDKDGKIRYTHFGEGKYDETEMAIQNLLKEAGSSVNQTVQNPDYQVYSRTPELYLGSARYQSGYTTFVGDWDQQSEYAVSGDELKLNFNAMKVFLVMRPDVDGQSGNVAVYLDNVKKSTLTIDEDKLYDLVSLDEAGEHELTLKFTGAKVRVYAFTFG